MSVAAPTVATMDDALTDREHDLLTFADLRWAYGGAKVAAIHERFGLTETRYYQQLNALIDRPAALAAEPLLVRRLQRLRADRQRLRSAARVRSAERTRYM